MTVNVESIEVPRLLMPMLRDAEAMREDSFASAHDIDTAMRLGAGHPLGPLAYGATLVPRLDLERPSVSDDPVSQDGPPSAGSATMPSWKGSVAVLGTGTMASGIIECVARGGREVVVLSRGATSSERSSNAIGRSLDRAVAKGRMSAPEAESVRARVRYVEDVEALAEAGLVIEAVAEDLGVKHELLAVVDSAVGPEAVIATNTSSYRVQEVARALRTGRAAIALHFFNPAPAMRLLEIVVPGGDAAVTARAVAFAREIGKSPVTCGDQRGFIVNRLLIPYLNDAVELVDRGLDPAVVDEAVRAEARHPMGPLALIDLIGLDVTVAALRSLHEAFEQPRMAPREGLLARLRAGRLGRKSGRGFFTYTP